MVQSKLCILNVYVFSPYVQVAVPCRISNNVFKYQYQVRSGSDNSWLTWGLRHIIINRIELNQFVIMIIDRDVIITFGVSSSSSSSIVIIHRHIANCRRHHHIANCRCRCHQIFRWSGSTITQYKSVIQYTFPHLHRVKFYVYVGTTSLSIIWNWDQSKKATGMRMLFQVKLNIVKSVTSITSSMYRTLHNCTKEQNSSMSLHIIISQAWWNIDLYSRSDSIHIQQKRIAPPSSIVVDIVFYNSGNIDEFVKLTLPSSIVIVVVTKRL